MSLYKDVIGEHDVYIVAFSNYLLFDKVYYHPEPELVDEFKIDEIVYVDSI